MSEHRESRKESTLIAAADRMARAILALRMYEGRAQWDEAEEARSAYLSERNDR